MIAGPRGALLLATLLSALPAAASAQDALRLTLRVDEQGVEVLSGRPVPGGPSTQGPLVELPDPRILHAEWLDDGRWRGGVIRRPAGLITVDVRGDRVGGTLQIALPDETLLLPLGPPPAPASSPRDGIELRTLSRSGPSELRQDLVFLAEGYQEAERENFFEDAQEVLLYAATLDPYSRYLSLANVHAVFAPSAESGADHPEESVPSWADTALGCGYGAFGIDRLIVCDDEAVLALSSEAPGEDVRVVLVNDPHYGGSGGAAYAAAFNGVQMAEVVVHEMSHSDAALADEYSYGVPSGGLADDAANCSASAESTSWEPWRDGETVDAFPGCAYTDWVRPTDDACLMNSLQDRFCPACRERLVQRAWEHVDSLLLAQSPEAPTLLQRKDEVTLSITTLSLPGEPFAVRWSVDGEEWATEGSELTLRGSELRAGQHEVLAEVWDDTPWIRGDRPPAMQAEARFAVEVQGGCGCEHSADRSGLMGLLLLAPLARRRRRSSSGGDQLPR